MTRAEAIKAAKKAKINGYFHHSYELEKETLRAFLSGDRRVFDNFIDLDTYSDVLAPERLRAIKNSGICAVAIICRAVIDNGVDPELSFSLSDYYINELEKQPDYKSVNDLIREIMNHYMDLSHQSFPAAYSLPVVKSLRYIHQHLFEPLHISDVAKAVKLSRTYLSHLFKKEVGDEISSYIREKKLEEAKNLILQYSYSTTEIAEMLGYCDLASFSNAFKKRFGASPRDFIKSSKRYIV